MKLISFILMILSFSACRNAFVPSGIQVPYVNRAGQVNANAQVRAFGGDVQASVGVTPSLAVAGSYSKLSKSGFGISFLLPTNYRYEHELGMAGIAYNLHFSRYFTLNVYSAYGGGSIYSWVRNGIVWKEYEEVNLRVRQTFLQGTIVLHQKKLQCGLALQGRYQSMDHSGDHHNSFWITPALYTKVGWKHIQLSTQFGAAIPTAEQPYRHKSIFAGLGVSFSLFNADEPNPDE